MMKSNTLYALDFDGVICNSAVETAMTGWRAAQSLWPDMNDQPLDDSMIRQFCEQRPCLEFGYEALLIMRLLQQGAGLQKSCANYSSQVQQLIQQHQFDVAELQALFGHTRDAQIQQDEDAWVSSNPVFAGVVDKLKVLDKDDWFVVTTKQERFVTRILQANGIDIAAERLFGLDRKLNKQQVLTRFNQNHPQRRIIFIEDRLPTLIGVQKNPVLGDIELQLVDWGYNTPAERDRAVQLDIDVISIDNFLVEKKPEK